MFNQQKMAQTIFNLAKDYTTNTTHIMKTSMEMYEKTLDTMLKQGVIAQQEGQKLLSDWMTRAKQGQQQYWNMLEQGIEKMERFFGPEGTKRATK
jgi:polyhydroxyalkanoate synthesis regulator phasin